MRIRKTGIARRWTLVAMLVVSMLFVVGGVCAFVALTPQMIMGVRAVSLRPWLKSSETERLAQENSRLVQNNLALTEALQESQRAARQCLTLPPDIAPRAIGTVLGFGFGSGYSTLFIQTRDTAAHRGDFVMIGDHTLVGVVDRTIGTVAIVKTLFHPDLKIAADIVPGAERGLVSATARGIVIDLLPETFTTATGTLLVETSGQDGLFRRGLLIGSITSVSPSSQIPLKQALVQPEFSIADVDAVMIMKNPLVP
jgi:hypothetical protein